MSGRKSINMCGFMVHYPREPYDQQIAITRVVLQACKNLENGAVEVPTGCGKTMALLCSALGFQVHERYKCLERLSNVEEKPTPTLAPTLAPTSTPTPGPLPKLEPALTLVSDPLNESSDVSFSQESTLVLEKDCPSSKKTTSRRSDRRSFLSTLKLDDDENSWPIEEARSPVKRPCHRPSTAVPDTTGDRPLLIDEGAEKMVFFKPDINSFKKDILPNTIALNEATPEMELHMVENKYEQPVALNSFNMSNSVPILEENSRVMDIEDLSGQRSCSNCVDTVTGSGSMVEPHPPPVTNEQIRQCLDQWQAGKRTPRCDGEFGPTRLLDATQERVPRIYYASRTHLQLEQVAAELRRSAYHDARAVVLASREYTCLNHAAYSCGSYRSRTEMCRDLLGVEEPDVRGLTADQMRHLENSLTGPRSGTGCFYFRNSKDYPNHDAVKLLGLGPIVDIKDLMRIGQRHKFCPYFTARSLVSSADIVLCPLNCILDPLVRKSLQLSLKGEIVVIDEAHILEDMCRESASLVISCNDLKDCLSDCLRLVEVGQLPHSHRGMAVLLEGLVKWTESNSQLCQNHRSNQDFSLPALQLMASLSSAGVTKDSVKYFINSLQEAMQHKANLSIDCDKATIFFKSIRGKTQNVCERLALVLEFLVEHPLDYVGAVQNTAFRSQQQADPLSSSSGSNSIGESEWELKLVCQNAALVFNSLSSITRTIILSSATLSPVDSMSKELGIGVKHVAIRGHVIPYEQTWIGCIGKSASGRELYATANNARTPEFLDEVGQIVLSVSRRVPYGILVFVTSYWLLDALVDRWQQSGLWNVLSQHKLLLSETRRSERFSTVLEEFTASVAEAQASIQGGLQRDVTGPLLVAVMRGKVSEGFNFTDDYTRAIITVGIPFPNFKEDAIKWKQEYNTRNVTRGLQSAAAWYHTQAFRALAQSLGRGLRHQNDWCVLLLLDTRLMRPEYYKSLPQWIQERMIVHRAFEGMLSSVEEFVQRRICPV